MEIQRQRSFNKLTVSHDFRREYKGSFLEKKFQSKKVEKSGMRLRSIAEWICSKASPKKSPTKNQQPTKNQITNNVNSVFNLLPNEILFEVLKNCKDDQSAMLACRRVSTRFNSCMDVIADVDVIVLSRLVITGLGKKGIEMRWVSYVGQKTNVITVPWTVIRSKSDFSFNFKRFAIQRIILKALPLCDSLIDFLRYQLQFSDLTKLIQLSLNDIDFSPANCLTLHRLIAPLAKTLEIFEIVQGYGMKTDSVTDEHIAQLDTTTIRRICIDGVRFAGTTTMSRHLKIGDGALKRFAELGAFPTIILDRCAVSTQVVCDYTKMWFEQCNESEKQLRSQVCTVKRCPKVKGSQFEAECLRRGLCCKNRRGSGSLTLYNVQEANTKREFTIALSALEEKELAEKKKTEASTNLTQPISVAV